MSYVVKIGWGAALSIVTLIPLAYAAQADDFKLSNNQRIACSRGLSAGKLNTATCKSYAYVFNTKTSEYFRCQVSLALTRDNKEVINVQTDGGCTKKPRIFEGDGNYSFDATETEAPNTNSFFGPGGYAIWASDNSAQKVRGCITISSGLGSDISKCVQLMIDNLPAAQPFAESSSIRPIAVSSAKRWPGFPDLPTIAEAGVAGYEASSWFTIGAPARTSKEIITKFNASVDKFLKTEDGIARLRKLGAEPAGGSPEDMQAYVLSETEKWGKVAKFAGIKPE